MYRFASWLTLAVAAAFLVVASTSPALGPITWLAFAVSIGTLLVSSAIALKSSGHVASGIAGWAIAVISTWTIVASLLFSESTVQHLALASSLAIGALALVGLTADEIEHGRGAKSGGADSTNRDTKLAAAA